MDRHSTLRQKIFALTVFPILLLGTVVILIVFIIIKGALISEVRSSLESAATATRAAYDQNSGTYLEGANGDIWKGSYNISKSEGIVDSIKEESGMEVTFFYGDRRIMTSAIDAGGDRILGSPAGEKVVQAVLDGGEEYFSEAVSIDGTLFYGFYVPVYQEGGASPIGMIFVGTNKAEKDHAISLITDAIAITVVALVAVFIIISAIYSGSISRSLKRSIGVVQSVAAGDLKVDIDPRLLGRKDEIGDLSRAIRQLQRELTRSLRSIVDSSKAVLVVSGSAEGTAREKASSIREVERAVTGIARSASMQAQVSDTASQNIVEMGEKIEQVSKEMEEMKSGAVAMKEAEEKTTGTIRRLLDSNVAVQELIREISAQTMQTNESAQKIKEAADIISSIADETGLLSLNASIEAVRAGESGRGFAVVAEQIKRLSSQSNESSKRIGEILRQLLADSDKTVATMGKVTKTISEQTANMQQTEDMTEEVMDKIVHSMSSLLAIEDSVSYLDYSRQEIVKTVNELSGIAKQNAATTQEVCAIVNVVSEGLKSIAGGLEESVDHFNV